MSLYKPVWYIVECDDKIIIRHNCNGGLNFICEDEISQKELESLKRAVEAGKRAKAMEIRNVLEI